MLRSNIMLNLLALAVPVISLSYLLYVLANECPEILVMIMLIAIVVFIVSLV